MSVYTVLSEVWGSGQSVQSMYWKRSCRDFNSIENHLALRPFLLLSIFFILLLKFSRDPEVVEKYPLKNASEKHMRSILLISENNFQCQTLWPPQPLVYLHGSSNMIHPSQQGVLIKTPLNHLNYTSILQIILKEVILKLLPKTTEAMEVIVVWRLSSDKGMGILNSESAISGESFC